MGLVEEHYADFFLRSEMVEQRFETACYNLWNDGVFEFNHQTQLSKLSQYDTRSNDLPALIEQFRREILWALTESEDGMDNSELRDMLGDIDLEWEKDNPYMMAFSQALRQLQDEGKITRTSKNKPWKYVEQE